ncbi:MAG: hypothetical protein M1823_005821 [Watsoniomyces obsoletus]|nr:MAG: hypothetical protein M1823_005821 [Watsoniomyces obsoletus]
MWRVALHLLARDLASDHDDAWQTVFGDVRMPAWGNALLIATGLLFAFGFQVIRYFYGLVIGTLAMVEAPSDRMMLGITPPQSADMTDDKRSEDPEIEVVLVKTPPMTSSLRQTRRALFTQHGLLVIAATASHYLVAYQVGEIVESVVRGLWIESHTRGIAGVLVGTLAASPFMIWWTHIVISTPSPERFSRLQPTRKTILRATPATLVYVVAARVTRDVPILMFSALKVSSRFGSALNMDRATGMHHLRIVAGQMLAIAVAAGLTAFLIYIPAIVTMVRVYAALLPESEETIVPFDPTFDGKVVSESEGGTGKLGLLDAWRSFKWSARFRLVKLYAKVFLLLVPVVMLYGLVTAVELRFIFGRETIEKIVERMRRLET